MFVTVYELFVRNFGIVNKTDRTGNFVTLVASLSKSPLGGLDLGQLVVWACEEQPH